MGRHALNLSYTFWWQPTQKDMEERSFAFYLFAYTLTDKFIYTVAASDIMYNISYIYFNFFRIPTQTENQQLSRNPPGLQHQIGTLDIQPHGLNNC